MPERVVWAILLTRHIDSAMEFYREAAGWRFERFEPPEFPCWVARTDEGEFLAVFVDVSGSNFPDAPELWLPHFTVDDFDRRIRVAVKQGGTILREPFEVPGFGRVAALRQPGGGIVAWRSLPAP
jgi:predicted enzyme related to lactoylglutathione lyase